MSARHPQIRQREQCHQLRGVLRQTSEARLHITELALDHPERVLNFGATCASAFSILRLALYKGLRLPSFL